MTKIDLLRECVSTIGQINIQKIYIEKWTRMRDDCSADTDICESMMAKYTARQEKLENGYKTKLNQLNDIG